MTNEMLAAHNRHLTLADDLTYTLTSDTGEVRTGTLKNGRIEERRVSVKAGIRLGFDKRVTL